MKLTTFIVIICALLVSSLAGMAVGTSVSQHSAEVSPLALVATPTLTPVIEPPQKLVIPTLGVNAAVEFVGLDDKKRMDVPQNPDNVAWYKYGAVPGQIGNAVIAGHLDSKTGPAVFYKLNNVAIGDEVIVADQSGKSHTFKVVDKANYPYDQFPLDKVFGPSPTARLNLITCEGTFNKQAQNYSHRTVIYTELVS